MKSRTELRGAILRMHEFGDTERKIAEALRISQSTLGNSGQDRRQLPEAFEGLC